MMENTSNYRWVSPKDASDTSIRRKLWHKKFQEWRTQRRQKRLAFLNASLSRKLNLDKSQSQELETFLLQFDRFQSIYVEERENSINNVLRALSDEKADLSPVAKGLDSSVERLHLQLDKVLEDFSVWVQSLDSGQRQILNQFVVRKYRRPFSHKGYNLAQE